MLGYGANVQAATIFMLLLDPVAKALMARFGGPAAAGYFEMASQVVLKVRAMIVTANQAIVPHVTTLAETEPARLVHLYCDNMRVLTFVALPTFSLLIAWAGGISWLLAGAYQPELVSLFGLLAIAAGGNVFAGPAFFTNMGTGRVGWNTLAHIIMGTLNASLGWLLGSHYGTQGVAVAYAVAVITGSLILIAVFERSNGLGWRGGLGSDHLGLAIACVAVAVLGWLEPLRPSTTEPAVLAVGVLLPPLVIGLVVWFHPMRQQLLVRLMSGGGRA
jgi:O-antigen/teichoic acid export membrane protein